MKLRATMAEDLFSSSELRNVSECIGEYFSKAIYACLPLLRTVTALARNGWRWPEVALKQFGRRVLSASSICCADAV